MHLVNICSSERCLRNTLLVVCVSLLTQGYLLRKRFTAKAGRLHRSLWQWCWRRKIYKFNSNMFNLFMFHHTFEMLCLQHIHAPCRALVFVKDKDIIKPWIVIIDIKLISIISRLRPPLPSRGGWDTVAKACLSTKFQVLCVRVMIILIRRV